VDSGSTIFSITNTSPSGWPQILQPRPSGSRSPNRYEESIQKGEASAKPLTFHLSPAHLEPSGLSESDRSRHEMLEPARNSIAGVGPALRWGVSGKKVITRTSLYLYTYELTADPSGRSRTGHGKVDW
jgi:hypothetical protein